MTQQPQSLIGMAKIMRLAFTGNDLSELTSELVGRVAASGSDAAALLDLSIVHQLNGHRDTALDLQWQALQQQQHYRMKSNPFRPALRVLAIMGPGEVMANTPIEFLVENSDIALEILYVGAGLPLLHDIPKHDVAFVAVCESDSNQQLLRQLQAVMSYWPYPHINHPQQIAKLARDGLCDHLSGIDGVEVVASRRVFRDELLEQARMWPDAPSPAVAWIVRPANSHAGHGLVRLETATELEDYLAIQPEEEFSMAPFIDYRSEQDGLYRKYRVASVSGKAYPAHMALSPRWMVHYLNADMVENADNRAAEAHFMDTFDWEFGARHSAALAAIDARIGLEYYSIDCGETADGRLLVFEIDSGAVVHSMDPGELFPYKQPHMQKLFSAFHGLLKQTAWGKAAASESSARRRRMAA
ncbi:MAG: hypothetical protein KDA51_07165 [Planctomycetales bacterium]|nr:hypothetical protein [Planctomycetales bacterium]MCA9181215.1 hypothetical protein [Planctomycetales bacterium]